MEDELPSEYDAVVLGTGKRSAVKMFSLYMILSLQLQTMRLELGMKYSTPRAEVFHKYTQVRNTQIVK